MNFGRGLILAAAVASLASCSSSGKGNSTSTTTKTPPTVGAGTSVTVAESEFAIALPSKSLAAGTYTFRITNKGKFPHNLTVEGPGISDKAASPTLSAGSAGDLTVTLQKGSYNFSCSVDSHKTKGMDVTVNVT